MAPRSIWNGAVSFGMVSIPVRMYPATSSKDISFNELHSTCKGRMKRQRWCPVCQREVAADEVTKGYEYTKGQYVEMTEEDFEKVPLPSKHTIEVQRFVKGEEIDPVYYDTAYVLEPGDMGQKPYALMMQALTSKNLVAIAHITIRKREQLCALRASGAHLMLETLYYSDELRIEPTKEAEFVPVSEAEQKMAEALMDMLAGEFDAKEYKDAYREALTEVISAKLEGKQVVSTPEAPTQVMDLMEALRASVEAAKARRAS
ncbi:MAG: Ku protein [Fimbriimonadaceae bacterium]